jgi:TRAP-type C4-dicarboxylate transport system permease small subunit
MGKGYSQDGELMNIFKRIDRLSSAGGIVSGITILLMSGLILLEVILRSATGISILIAEEYSAYLLVVFGSMALAYTLKSEGHIRVDLILLKLPDRGRSIVHLCCSILGFSVFVFAACQAWGQCYGSWLSHETSMYYSKTPLWLPQLSIFVGSALMALQLLSTVASQFHSLGKTQEEMPPKDQG